MFNRYGIEVILGKILYDETGKKLDEPIDDVADNFGEIDVPEQDDPENNNVTGA